MKRANESDDLDAAAAAWAVRLGEGLSAPQQAELDAWLARDTRRLGALVRAEAAWSDLDRVSAFARGRPPEVARRPARARAPRGLGLAAGLAAAVLLGGGVMFDQLSGRYAADAGEVRRIVLDDGSTVVLNAGSVVRIRYRDDRRHIDLRRGEASFAVAHDASRPFVVRAGDLRVRAVGTEFAVRLRDQQVAVTVAEGVVEVKRPETGPDARRVIYEHDQILASPEAPLTARNIGEEEVERQLAWRDGLLIFDGETLQVAVAEVNRYASTPVTIEDPALGRERLVGVFRLGDSRAFARAAAATFNAQMTEGPEGLHLSRKENPHDG